MRKMRKLLRIMLIYIFNVVFYSAVDGYYGHMDDDRGSSSSGSQYGTSPRGQTSSSPRGTISPYAGYNNPGTPKLNRWIY